MKAQNTEALIRAWLKVRIEAFLPRIEKLKPTRALPYTFSLEELAADMRRTLTELEERIANKGL